MKTKKLKAIPWDPSESVRESAARVLPLLAGRLFEAGRHTVHGKKLTTKRLHGFRLEVKRFRYSLELFRPLYGPALDQRLARLRRLQQLLGRITDCASIRSLLTAGTGKKARPLARILHELDSLEKERTRKFLGYWRESFDAPGEEQAWVRYLRNYAGRRKSRFRVPSGPSQPNSGRSNSPSSSG